MQWGLGGARGGRGVQMGPRDVKVRPGTHGRRVGHIDGAWNVLMGAETCKRGLCHMKGGCAT